MMFRIGNGYDVHALSEGLPMVLGGVRIEHTHGFVAHSDGDVLIHALCDALLGALALGDIGAHFPDTDPAYKGADSKILLKRVYALVLEHGYELSNADCTIVAQAPRLLPHIEGMRTALAQVMSVGVDQISVKATTTERLGFEGRAEGIASMASVLIRRVG